MRTDQRDISRHRIYPPTERAKRGSIVDKYHVKIILLAWNEEMHPL